MRRASSRRSVLDQSFRSGRLETRRTVFSVALACSSPGECAAKFGSPEMQRLVTTGITAVCGTARLLRRVLRAGCA